MLTFMDATCNYPGTCGKISDGGSKVITSQIYVPEAKSLISHKVHLQMSLDKVDMLKS